MGAHQLSGNYSLPFKLACFHLFLFIFRLLKDLIPEFKLLNLQQFPAQFLLLPRLKIQRILIHF